MIYPAYIHIGDENQAHGVTMPDFQGCFAAADNHLDLPVKIQEAVELHLEGETFEIPSPSDINDLEKTGNYKGGMWMLLDIDLSSFDSRPIRLNVTLPESVVKKMDDFTSQNNLTRSALITKATEEFLNTQSP